ncbi:hypothetical protein GCM10022233_00580 [Streptomyces shaanxiensis]|uniref:Uncharacterized protein n=1 Tax=Streptomyces shaanxiensis TaxID=653357 RepID=A0ABP7U7U2_9ACTN
MGGLAPGERFDHLGQQAPGPLEQLVVARDVVEVQHRGVAERPGQLPGERGLSGAGVPVDGDQADRAAGRGEAAESGGEVVNRFSRSEVEVGIFIWNILVVGEADPGGVVSVTTGRNEKRCRFELAVVGCNPAEKLRPPPRNVRSG